MQRLILAATATITALTFVEVVAVIAPAQAATITSTQIDCGAASSSDQTVATALASGDSLSVSYDNCNGFTVSWSGFNSSASIAGQTRTSGYSENGNNAETGTLTNFDGTIAASNPLFTITNGTKTFRILQSSSVWTARTPTAGTVGTSYTYQFAATGGSNYLVTSGSVPTGLSLSSTGELSGTPTQPGTYTFTVSATVSSASNSAGSISMTIAGAPITKVTICHRTRATTNPYVLITVSVNSVIGSGGSNGHDDHNTTRTNTTNPTTNAITPGSGPFDTSFTYPANRKWWGDIIPPFTYTDGTTRTYAGLNWSSDWLTPNPVGGSANDWLEDSEFATAIRTAPGVNTNSVYYKAVEQCMNLSSGAQSTKSAAMDTPQKYFNVSVNNGENPDSVEEDLTEQQAIENPASGSTPRTIPSVSTLETTYESTAATVATDPATDLTTTTATLNGTLKSGTTWDSWKYEWGASESDVRGGSGSSYTYQSGIDSGTSVGAGPRTPEHEVTGLTCGTTYYFRVVGTDNASPATVTYGLFRSFRTRNCNSGGGGSGGGGSNNGGATTSTTTPTPSSTPSSQRPLGNGRPTKVIIPTTSRPITPGSTPGSIQGGSTPPGTSPTPSRPTQQNPPRVFTPASLAPEDPTDPWVPTSVQLEDPKTGTPTNEVRDNQGTWRINPTTGAVTFTPEPGFVGTAVLNVQLSARSGRIGIFPMRVRVNSSSRVLVLGGGLPADISGGVARTP